jgi:hypothetical protein
MKSLLLRPRAALACALPFRSALLAGLLGFLVLTSACSKSDGRDESDEGGQTTGGAASSSGGGSSTSSGGGSSTSTGGSTSATGGGSSGEPPKNTNFDELLSEAAFHQIFPITDPSSPLQEDFAICPSNCRNVTTYAGLVEAAGLFPEFAAVGTEADRKREIAAFLANVAKETTGGWPEAPGGKEAWGLCYCEEVGGSGYTDSADPNYQAVPGQSYHGRGSIQMSYPYNYGPFSEFVYGDKNVLLQDPGRLLTEARLFWASGLYFWMNEAVAPDETPPNGAPSAAGMDGKYYKPSCHMAMTESWTPRASDIQKNRTFGLGVTINVINGGLECGGSWDDRGKNRVAFYDKFIGILGGSGVPDGWIADDYKTCQSQQSFDVP